MGEEDSAPSADEQKLIVLELLEKSMEQGETWYLVDAVWMRSLKQYLGMNEGPSRSTQFHPGPVDNKNLIDSDDALKPNLAEREDYELVPQELWTKLVDWYGMSPSPSIARTVTEVKPGYKVVEVYLVKLRCGMDFSMDPERVLSFSRTTSMRDVEEKLRAEFCIDKNSETRLWLSTPGTSYELVDMDKTLSDVVAGSEGNSIVIESKKSNSRWVEREDPSKKKISNENLSNYSNAKVSRMTTPNQPGLCGLTNLGNTCFMNAVLQCMSNCPPVTEYFLAGRHMEELNKVNPLGMGGEIAVAFGNLITTMWSGNHGYTSPIQFKLHLGRFNPVFSGCQQHDSQELLTFLLDGLHEDLNRIKQKPYIQINDDSEREDKILAQEAWDRHRKRNDSIIVDTFHGLLKSRVVCPDCKKVSVTFDPFCNLSLPLPQKKDRTIVITYIPHDSHQEIYECRLRVPCQGSVHDLCREVGMLMSVNPSKLLVADIAQSHFHKLFNLEDPLDSIQDRNAIHVYEIAPAPGGILIPVCFWEDTEVSERFDNSKFFGVPFFLSVPEMPISETALRLLLLDKMRRNLKIKELNGPELLNADNSTFRIYTKNTDDVCSLATPLDLKKENDLFELSEDNSEIFCGRTIMILGFTKELKREVYTHRSVGDFPEKNYRYNAKQRDGITMADCLSLFITCEKLGADNAWYCPTCKKHQMATKKFDLWDLPKILIVHLKRFSYSRLLRDKIDAMVDCPLKNLDMGQYLIKRDRPQCMYNLIGVCNHYGGMGGGHYTACCKNKDTGEWYYFDDSSVRPTSEDRVLTSAAYVLFYLAADQ